MGKSAKKKLKKIFNLYNIALVGCVIMIVVALFIIIEPDISGIFEKISTATTSEDKNTKTEEDTSEKNNDEVKIVKNNNSGEEISEKDARKLAQKQFKELGEKDVKTDKLEVLKIEREGEEYYFISSPENTTEIKISSGEITRINSIKVEQ